MTTGLQTSYWPADQSSPIWDMTVGDVLRRAAALAGEREALVAEALREPLARFNYPQWWIDTMRAAYPRDWEAVLEAGNVHPPLTLRVNRRKTDVSAYLHALNEAGLQAEQ
ncbi:hypothetical protein LTR94_032131, partial [Friedmanniomyces endolithicus]